MSIDQLDKTMQNISTAIEELNSSRQTFLSEFDKIHKPLTNISRNVTLLESKMNLNSNT